MGDNIPSTLSHHYLLCLWKKGLRNGNWRKLNRVEKALYMASLTLAKIRGRIVNSRLILQLGCIIGKLRETVGDRRMSNAYQRAMKLFDRFSVIGLFEWAPQVKSWFEDPVYIIWLGISP